MDLNYLFHRQQVERSRATSAASEAASRAHAGLAREYEVQITQLTDGNVSFLADRQDSQRSPSQPWLGIAGAAAAILVVTYLQSR